MKIDLQNLDEKLLKTDPKVPPTTILDFSISFIGTL